MQGAGPEQGCPPPRQTQHVHTCTQADRLLDCDKGPVKQPLPAAHTLQPSSQSSKAKQHQAGHTHCWCRPKHPSSGRVQQLGPQKSAQQKTAEEKAETQQPIPVPICRTTQNTPPVAAVKDTPPQHTTLHPTPPSAPNLQVGRVLLSAKGPT
jgi:hypothetical protein